MSSDEQQHRGGPGPEGPGGPDGPDGPDGPGPGGTGRPGEPGDVGDLGEEAARLLAVLAGWTKAVDEHVATGAPECQWCPLCRMVHVVRTSSPEVRDHLATAASSLLQAAASLLSPPTGSDRGPGSGKADEGLEHIDLDEPEGER